MTSAAIIDLTKSNDAVDLTKSSNIGATDAGDDEEVVEVGVVTACNGNVKVPFIWPMVSPQLSKRYKGGHRIFNRITMKNLSRLHLKTSKKTMSKTDLRGRAAARTMAEVIDGNVECA